MLRIDLFNRIKKIQRKKFIKEKKKTPKFASLGFQHRILLLQKEIPNKKPK